MPFPDLRPLILCQRCVFSYFKFTNDCSACSLPSACVETAKEKENTARLSSVLSGSLKVLESWSSTSPQHGQLLPDHTEQRSPEFFGLSLDVVLDDSANNFNYLEGTTLELNFAGDSFAGWSSVRTIRTDRDLANLVQAINNDRLWPASNGNCSGQADAVPSIADSVRSDTRDHRAQPPRGGAAAYGRRRDTSTSIVTRTRRNCCSISLSRTMRSSAC